MDGIAWLAAVVGALLGLNFGWGVMMMTARSPLPPSMVDPNPYTGLFPISGLLIGASVALLLFLERSQIRGAGKYYLSISAVTLFTVLVTIFLPDNLAALGAFAWFLAFPTPLGMVGVWRGLVCFNQEESSDVRSKLTPETGKCKSDQEA